MKDKEEGKNKEKLELKSTSHGQKESILRERSKNLRSGEKDDCLCVCRWHTTGNIGTKGWKERRGKDCHSVVILRLRNNSDPGIYYRIHFPPLFFLSSSLPAFSSHSKSL